MHLLSLRLWFLLALMLATPAAFGFVEEGDQLGEHTVTRIDAHDEYLRVWFDGPTGQTGIEVVSDNSEPGGWTTGRHRLMPPQARVPLQYFPNERLLEHAERYCSLEGTWSRSQILLWRCPIVPVAE